MKIILFVLSLLSFSQLTTIRSQDLNYEFNYLKDFQTFNGRSSSFNSFSPGQQDFSADNLNLFFSDFNVNNIPLNQFQSDEILIQNQLYENLRNLRTEFRRNEDGKNPINLSNNVEVLLSRANRPSSDFRVKILQDYEWVNKNSIQNAGLTCANGEYCIFRNPLINLPSSSTVLGYFNGIRSNGSIQRFLLETYPRNIDRSSEVRAIGNVCGSFFGADAKGASAFGNWACESGRINRCSTYCFNSQCSSDINFLFNTYYLPNSNGIFSNPVLPLGNYTLIGNDRVGGDLRRGCGGNYVYQVQIRLRESSYYIRARNY